MRHASSYRQNLKRAEHLPICKVLKMKRKAKGETRREADRRRGAKPKVRVEE